MLLLGIDLGTSSVKVSVVDAQSQQCVASASYPEIEEEIIAVQPGWAEQNPDRWWQHVQQAILKCHASAAYDPKAIGAIGIAYQMHGLVLVDKQQRVLRHSIIWCDSRAVETGNRAFRDIGEDYCLSHLLNSPGNFTASKLAWVKEQEPAIYEKIDRVMLPGDFIAMRLTGSITTTTSALSEGIFWDFREEKISDKLIRYYGFDLSFFPEQRALFSPHGYIRADVAAALSLREGIPVSYKAGDQPNNALSLNVLNPGEVAATAGTSGVIYGVYEELNFDPQSRINSFAHVNHESRQKRIGVLLCINGTGIFNRWIRNVAGGGQSYAQLNKAAAAVSAGADGLFALPFGNGAERMLNNQLTGAAFEGIDLNKHQSPHLVRAVQEGIAFSFRYGMDIMRENGVNPSVIRAAHTNLFLSDLFTRVFAAVNKVAVEFYEGDGSFGAAIGAGIGAAVYTKAEDALKQRKAIKVVEPAENALFNDLYEKWKGVLQTRLQEKCLAPENREAIGLF